MATIFNEDNTIEQMMLSTLQKNGWKYIPAEELPRMYSDVLVEPMVKEALIRLNPEIAEDPDRPDLITENRPRKPVFGGFLYFYGAAICLFFGIVTFTGM